jgi:D-3-phosphoglycerate dehydrogenase
LKAISRCGIGMDSVDLDAAQELAIIVTNTPEGPTIAVAELTLGLIFSVLRRIHIADNAIRKNEWVRPMGYLLSGKTIGLIGCGRIGSHLAGLLSSLNSTVIAYDILGKENACWQSVSLDVLLSQADIVSLHMPYNRDNHHFINHDRIMSMKKGAFLINAARGGLVDEKALFDALTSGQLAGAALDCFEQEPYQGNFTRLDNVLLTGHIGSYAREARVMMEQQSVDNLLKAMKEAGV